MCEKERRKIVVPANQGYGKTGVPGFVPPNKTLVYEVRLVKNHRQKKDY